MVPSVVLTGQNTPHVLLIVPRSARHHDWLIVFLGTIVRYIWTGPLMLGACDSL